MVDLETLGTKVDSVFVSIGACLFDLETGEIGETFYEVVNWQDSLNKGRSVTEGTLKFWIGQAKESTEAICKTGIPLKEALKKFAEYFREGDDGSRRIWGNGATFDVSILQHAYENTFKSYTPWKFYSVMDVRTILYLAEVRKGDIVFKGTEHHPVDDCKHQVKLVNHAYKLLKKEESLL